ncbi:MAG TPA: gluconate 2-dehydrogenase subunit 3 family protein [Vicinamibacterales bacterium]|jgi:gluconate 2-dehydrogenase gamma chain|nr:gluconate 2-dehydrogenase subunit 3 family protein [Vicinamibacterales bacterium]
MTRNNRRDFLKTVGTVGATGIAAAVGGEAVEAQAPATAAAKTAAPVSHAYAFLTAPEAAFIEAAVDRFIPADELTPSGTDCGVAVFIDRQLAGAWGSGDRTYMQGPWQKGVPTQGYQSPLTPAEFFRAGIAASNAHCRKTFNKDFDRLTSDQQNKVLQDMEQGRVTFDTVSAQEFFNLLLAAAMQGFFADPMYGGNRDKAAWKMIGFPGVIAIYSEHIKTYRNKKYDVEPKSILDLS